MKPNQFTVVARAFWSAPVLWRCGVLTGPSNRTRGLAPSKSWRNVLTTLFLLVVLFTPPSPLHSQPAPPPNRVLDLDGAGDYVRLPPAGFTNFHQATIEAWVKWRSAAALSARVFDFGARQREMYMGNANSLKFLLVDAAGTRRREDVYGGFRLNEWTHVAVVTGPGGVRIYLNGMLVVTNGFAGSLSSRHSY